jgi:DNA-binding winged helix-turn-helix (wHTH) protein
MIYSFNSFIVNTDEYLFSDGTENKRLEPLVFDTLVYLIENRDRIVPKDELIEKLWSGRVITDSALNTCIRSIRKALDDSRDKQKYIRTFPKRGFQFVARIEPLIDCSDKNSLENSESGFVPKTESSHRLGKIALFATVLIVLIGYSMLNWYEPKSNKSVSPKPVIAVLDFTTALNDETQ